MLQTAFMRMKKVTERVCRVQHTSSLYVDSFEKCAAAHFLRPVAPILVLNGNIGGPQNYQTKAFIEHCSKYWDTVFYVPGPLELKNNAEHNMEVMNALADKYRNVHVMADNTIHLSGYNTTFIGNILRTETNSEFNKDIIAINSALETCAKTDSKLVVLSHGIPYPELRLPLDTESGAPKHTPLPRINSYMNAWICGYSRGGSEYVTNDGVVYAYNARGHIAKDNDFTGTHGWRRDAYIDIPNNDDLGGCPELIA
jgi:hypothetical protein